MQPKEKRGLRPLRIGAAIAVVAAGGALAAPSFGASGGPLTVKMTGDQVVPAGTGAPNGRGHATVRVRPPRQRLCFDMTFRDVGPPVRGYIFRGRRGQQPPNPNRPAVTLFGQPESSPEAGCVKGLRKKLLRRIKQRPRRFHVVLVNGRYPNGAIRGQLRRPRN